MLKGGVFIYRNYEDDTDYVFLIGRFSIIYEMSVYVENR